MELFDTPPQEHASSSAAPLAERVRPRTLDEFIGQEHLLGEGKSLRVLIGQDRLPSMILWGPPGSGKTTLARLIAGHTRAEFFQLNAVAAGVKEVRSVIEKAKRSAGAADAPYSSSTRYTGSTSHSRMPCSTAWRTGSSR